MALVNMSIFSKAKHYGLARKKYKFEMKIHRLILPTSANKLLCRVLWSRRKKKSEKYKTSWTEGIEEFYINQVINHNATIFLTHKTNQFQSKYTTISIEIKDNITDKKYTKYCSFKIDLSDFINITSPNKIFNKHLKYKSTKGTKKAEIIFSMKSNEIILINDQIIDNNSSIFSNDDNINDPNLSSKSDQNLSNISIISKDIDSIQFNELKKKHVANQRKLLASSTPHLSNSSNSSHSSGNSKDNKEILILRHNNNNTINNNTNSTPSSPYAAYTKYAQNKQQQQQQQQQQNEDEYKYENDDEEEEELSDNPPPFLLHTPQTHENDQINNDTIINIRNNGYSPITNDSNTPISIATNDRNSNTSNNSKYQSRIQILNTQRNKKSNRNIAGSAISVCSTDDDDDDEEEKKDEAPVKIAREEEEEEEDDENIDELQSRFSWTLNTSLNRARNRSLISVGTIGSVDLDGLDLATPKSSNKISNHRLNNDELDELRQLRLDKIYWKSKLIEFDKIKNNFIKQDTKIEKLKKTIENLKKDRDRLQLKVSSLQTVIEHQKNEKYNSFGTFKYMTYLECDKLDIGDYIDHRDITGHYLLAKIINKKKSFIHIHYEGWASKWDIWINYKKECESNKISIARSISRKSNTRFLELQISDNIDINPIQRHQGWTQGKIKKMDKYSGQVQVEYIHQNEKYFYWAHLNDIKEIAPFMTKSCDL